MTWALQVSFAPVNQCETVDSMMGGTNETRSCKSERTCSDVQWTPPVFLISECGRTARYIFFPQYTFHGGLLCKLFAYCSIQWRGLGGVPRHIWGSWSSGSPRWLECDQAEVGPCFSDLSVGLFAVKCATFLISVCFVFLKQQNFFSKQKWNVGNKTIKDQTDLVAIE